MDNSRKQLQLPRISRSNLGMAPINTYAFSNYRYRIKEQELEDTCIEDTAARMKLNYAMEGMTTSVGGILVVHENNHPHLLLLKDGNICKLPGGRLKTGESDVEGLKRILSSQIGVDSHVFVHNWQIGECVATWWRPNFERVFYPYLPPHITKPKERKRLYLVHLSEKEYFAVPKNIELVAVPFFDLYDNAQNHGVVISNIPVQLSRFQLKMINS